MREEPGHSHLRVEFGDGGADVYLDNDGIMANHISGGQSWDLLLAGLAEDWVILPVGRPTGLTHKRQRAHLPEGLDDDVMTVAPGLELLSVIRSA